MQSTSRSAITMLAVLALSACSRNPAAPTPLPTPSPVTVTGELSGTWTGEYAVTGCAPMQAPNQCTWYVPLGPEAMTLTLTQSGASLSGTFTSGIIGPLAVTGTVDAAGVVRLAGSRPSQFQCYQPSIRANEVADWVTEITKDGELRGTFRQSTEQILSSCYTGRYDYFTQILSLRRQDRSPSVVLPPMPPSPDARTISGTIRDVRTNAPAAQVPVTWHARGNDYAVLGSAAATTDAAGRFTVRLPNAGYYAVTFDHLPGHAAAIVRYAAAADLFVMPEGCNWIRYGTIVDAATGRPIAGARISASGKSTVSGADGSYFLDWGCSNPAGARNTVVEHAAYASANQFAFDQDAVRGIARLDFALSAR